MTAFVKEKFQWDGMYLMYAGQYEGAETYDEVYGADKIHPTRIGVQKEAFIARFKYGRKPWKTWVNFLVKNFTVEEYLAVAEATTPLDAMRSKGYTRK